MLQEATMLQLSSPSELLMAKIVTQGDASASQVQ